MNHKWSALAKAGASVRARDLLMRAPPSEALSQRAHSGVKVVSEGRHMRMDAGNAGTASGRFDDLLDVLQHRALSMPERVAFTFLDGEGREEDRATFRQLDERARTIAAMLQARGYQGKTVLLLYPPGLQYIAALLGSMYAGCIAVPSYPPRPRQLARFVAILTDSGAAAALTSRAVLSVVNERYRDMADALPIEWVATDAEPPDQPPSFDPSQG